MIAALVAQIPTPNPTLDGMPGAGLVQQFMDWGGGLVLVAIGFAFLFGVYKIATGGGSGNGGSIRAGQSWVVGAFVATILLFALGAIITVARGLGQGV